MKKLFGSILIMLCTFAWINITAFSRAGSKEKTDNKLEKKSIAQKKKSEHKHLEAYLPEK